MITYEQAKDLATNRIQEISQKGLHKVVLQEDKTASFEYGWVFYYYPEEGLKNPSLRFGGGGPIIVGKTDGWILQVPSRRSAQHYIDLYTKFMDDWKK